MPCNQGNHSVVKTINLFLQYYIYIYIRRLYVTNLSLENNLPTFQLNALIVIRAKVKKCEQTLLFIAGREEQSSPTFDFQ